MRCGSLAGVVGALAYLFVQPSAEAASSLGTWALYDHPGGMSGNANVGAYALGSRVSFGPDVGFNTGFDLFEGVRIGQDDAGRRFVANTTTDPDFTAIAALLTNGFTGDKMFGQTSIFFPVGYSASAAILDEAYWANGTYSTAPADFNGYILDHIDLVVELASWNSPGLDPNGDGKWTDYQVDARLEFFGTPVPEPTLLALLPAGLAALARRRRH